MIKKLLMAKWGFCTLPKASERCDMSVSFHRYLVKVKTLSFRFEYISLASNFVVMII